MSDVPGEILSEILSRLPVIDLIRFRCVSKPWKSLIDSNDFTRHHLNRSLNTRSNLNIIFESPRLYSTDFDALNETNLGNFQQLYPPLFPTKFGILKVLGSCNGLLALTNHAYYDTTILWNPSVKRFRRLPYEGFGGLNINYISYGFGYDAVNDDYKLVRLVQVMENVDIEVKVYSLKSDSWRRISDFADYCLRNGPSPGELANGALHWNVGSKVKSDTASASLVIAFDLGTEEFRSVPLPEVAGCTCLFVFGGCLGVMFYVKNNVNVWVMKEYGVQESWSFLFTFDICPDEFRVVRPIAYSKCNRKVLVGLDARVLMWYDLDKKSTDFPTVEMPRENSNGLHTCLESLVLLNNSTCDFDPVANTTKKQERKAKKRKSTSLMLE